MFFFFFFLNLADGHLSLGKRRPEEACFVPPLRVFKERGFVPVASEPSRRTASGRSPGAVRDSCAPGRWAAEVASALLFGEEKEKRGRAEGGGVGQALRACRER